MFFTRRETIRFFKPHEKRKIGLRNKSINFVIFKLFVMKPLRVNSLQFWVGDVHCELNHHDFKTTVI